MLEKYVIKMPTKYKSGIENLPLRQINTYCPIIVIITDLTTNEVVSTIELDYAKFDDRKHMGRLTFWCVSNKHSMETLAKADVDLACIEG